MIKHLHSVLSMHLKIHQNLVATVNHVLVYKMYFWIDGNRRRNYEYPLKPTSDKRPAFGAGKIRLFSTASSAPHGPHAQSGEGNGNMTSTAQAQHFFEPLKADDFKVTPIGELMDKHSGLREAARTNLGNSQEEHNDEEADAELPSLASGVWKSLRHTT